MFGSWIRRTVYWTLDTVKGGKVKQHLNDIKEKMLNNKSIDDDLNIQLKYVCDKVPFYMNKGYKKLSDFPIINKNDIMSAYDQFRSVEYRNNEELHEVATSGSSGNPFHAFQNADKRNRVVAELMYVHDHLGWKIGDRYIFMRAWTGHYNNMSFQQFKQNFIPIEVTKFDVEQMDKMRQLLKKDRKIKVIIGYSSSLAKLAQHMLDNGDCPDMFNVKVIIADSDTLTSIGKSNLEKVFGCPVISRYDNEEQGILAYTEPYSDEYIVNIESYYVEILSMDGDYPAKPGETGRIVVTDMYNKAMGFIRYDTGDLAIAGKTDNGRCITIKSLQGRTSDIIYDVEGNSVCSASVNNYVCDFYDIKKYQLIQVDSENYDLLLVCTENSSDIKGIDENLHKLLGENAKINLQIVDDIPSSNNGKFKTVVNLYKRN